MKTLRASLVLAVSILATAPAHAGGLIGGLLEFDAANRADARDRYVPRCWALGQPAAMDPASPMAVIEYTSENLIRSKTGGVLTEDAGTSGQARAVYVPLGTQRWRTVVALSEGSSLADMYSNNARTGGRLRWDLDSSAWALAQNLGKIRLGATASRFSGGAKGTWAYPKEAFGLFAAAPQTTFDISGQDHRYQISCQLSPWARLLASTGASQSNYGMSFAGSGSVISVPFDIQARTRGVEMQFDLGKRATASIGSDASSGNGSTPIYLGSAPEGSLSAHTRYSNFAGSLTVRRSAKTDLLAGYVADSRALDLSALNVRGTDLGVDVKPFNEKIDFDARATLLDNFSYVGVRRRYSERWGMDAFYRRIHIRSRLNVDYTGRAFFGLVSASGNYSTTFFDSRAHALQLALRYTHKGLSAVATIEQLVPMSSGRRRAPSSQPRPRVEATGGTNFSLSVCYGLQ